MNGHLVIADISGYTRFLTESELDHATGILEELLNAVIAAVNAPLTLSSIEGDAVLLYGTMPDDSIGQSVIDSVERLYVSFRSALQTMVINTTCQCNACVNINDLGLKIVMHCGDFVVSNVGGRESLAGPNVILIHRLLKNSVVESTGVRDYLLLTEACVRDLGIESMVSAWSRHSEEYEHVGRIDGYVSNLEDVWDLSRSQTEDKVMEREAWFTVQSHSPAPVGVVWDFLLDPVKRTRWLDANEATLQGIEAGRIGPGTEYHCAHGPDNDIAIIAVLDMRAHDYMTQTAPVGPDIAVKWTDFVVPSGGGTRIVTNVGRAFEIGSASPLSEEFLAAQRSFLEPMIQMQVDRLADMAGKAVVSSI